MACFPQLQDEDVQAVNSCLAEFLDKSEATAALVTAEGGFLIFQQGETGQFDATTLGALASNAFNATQAIASLIDEPSFTSIYQQGARHSMLICNVDLSTMLIVLFPASISVGSVKYYAAFTIKEIARQLGLARQRTPEIIDLAMLNLPDSTNIFRKQ
jgi:predicted regulator of Ras-like GTPase activity (Roadblock/LC7/MglB family)